MVYFWKYFLFWKKKQFLQLIFILYTEYNYARTNNERLFLHCHNADKHSPWLCTSTFVFCVIYNINVIFFITNNNFNHCGKIYR